MITSQRTTFSAMVHTIYLECILLKIKVLHRKTFLSKWFHKEPLISEEPFCFTKVSFVAYDYKKVSNRWFCPSRTYNKSVPRGSK